MLPMQLNSAAALVDTLRIAIENKFAGEQIAITKLHDNTGVIAILPMRSDGKSNAQIIDTSGAIRCEVEIPQLFRGGIGFSDAYYVRNELIAIFVNPNRDFAFVVDEKTGNIIRNYETR